MARTRPVAEVDELLKTEKFLKTETCQGGLGIRRENSQGKRIEVYEENDVDDEASDSSSDGEAEVDPAVSEDMAKFEESFKGITKRFKLINRIGEGTRLLLSPIQAKGLH
jgi:cell division control protein 7